MSISKPSISKPMSAAELKAALGAMNRQNGSTLSYMALEPRIVFDGAGVAVAADVVDHAAAASAPAPEPATQVASDAGNQDLVDALHQPDALAEGAANEVVFIDSAVSDPGVIAAAILDGADVVMLSGGSDGLGQIAAYLGSRSGVTAIHIVSHGEPGEVRLGNTTLTAVSMGGEHADDLAVIKAALAVDADILLYGCDVAASDQGLAFLAALSDATGADVAASNDDTGSAEAGGDWQLEARTGPIEAGLIDVPEWNGILAPLVISVSNAPIVTGTGAVGTTALWTNAGTIGGSPIDLRATVTSLTTLSGLPFFGTAGDDAFFQLTNQGNATLRWEIFASGTNQTVYAVGTPEFRISDVDGVGSVTNSRESVQPSLNSLTNYTLSTPTNLVPTVTPAGVQVSGTQDQNGESTSLVGFVWNDVSSWDVKYTLHLNQAGVQARFLHDGDGDFTFVAPSTTYLLGIDLDGNNSTATGTAYQTTYVEGASGVPVVDTDVAITQNIALGANIHGASVVLTNAQSNDLLLVNGSSNTSGIVNGLNYTLTTSGGQITVTLSGTATPVEYQTALAAITFANTSDTPSLVDRNVTVSVTNATFETTSNTAIATIKVTPVNDPPIATPSTSSGNEDTNIPVGLAGTDVDGTVTNVTVTTLPTAAQGILYLANGTTPVVAGTPITAAQAAGLVFKPTANFNGTFTIPFTVTDNNGAVSVSANEVITVVSVNDPPIATPSTSSGNEDTDIPVGLAGTDVDGTVTNVTVTTLPTAAQGILYLANGTTPVVAGTPITAAQAADLVFRPTANFAGTVTIPFTVTDNNGAVSASANEVITVTAVNDAPVALDNTKPVIEDMPATGNVINDAPGTDTDLEGDPLSIVDFTIPGVGTVLAGQTASIPSVGTLTIAANGNYTFTPAPNYNGAVPVATYTVRDPSGLTDTATLTLTITPVDDPLGITGLANGPAGSGTDASVEESDLPAGSTPAGTGENATGTFTLVPIDGLGSLTVAGTTIPAATLAATSPAAPITITGANGTLVISGYDPTTGVVSYGYTLTALADHTGGPVTDPFAMTIADIDGDTANATLAILIVDDVPTAANDTASVTEDATTTATGNLMTANDTVGADVTSTPVTGVVAGNSSPAGTGANLGNAVTGTYGALTLNPDGSYTYLLNNGSDAVQGLALGETVNDVFTYEITDADGDTSVATLTVAIVGTNDAPVVIDPANPGTPENPIPAGDPLNIIPDVTTVDSATPPALDVSDFIVDPDGDTLSFTATGLPPGLTLDQTTGIISGTLPADASQGGPNNDGIYTITVTATDPHGATTTTTVTYTVTNPPPVAVNDVGTVTEDIPATGNVLTDGTDDSDPDGDALVVTAFNVGGTTYTAGQSATLPGVGALTIGTDGVYTFTPSSNYTGAIPVATYTISDGEGGMDTATLTLTIVPVNDTPVVIDPTDPGTPLNPKEPADPDNIIPDVTTVDSATPPAIDVSDYIADPEGNPLTYTATGLPSGLALDSVTGIISGTLPADASQGGPNADGVYPVIVTLTDTGGLSTTTTITYTVANPPPVAVDDVGSVTEDVPATGNVLTDATDDSDPDGDALTVTGFEVGGISYTPGQTAMLTGVGTLTIGTDGVYTFTPATSYTGAVPVVTYTISDGEGGNDTATLTLTMIAVNDPPVAVDDANSVGEDAASVAGNVITGPGTDSDIDSPVLTVVSAKEGATPLVIGQPFTTAGGGVLTLSADGSYTFAPGTAYNGLDIGETATETVTYTVSDGNGGTDTAQLVITIVGANDTPVIIDPTNPVNNPTNPLYDPENPVGPTDPLNIIPDVSRTDGQPLDPINVADFVPDPDGEPLSFAVDPTTPSWIVIDPVTGVITGTPPANASQLTNTGNPGEYLVTITATDPDGTVATTTVTLTIANLPPVANNDANSVGEDVASVAGNVITATSPGDAADADTAPDSDPLTVTVANQSGTPITIGQPFTTAGGGVLTLSADGSYTFAPGTAYNGLDIGETATETVTYTVSDGNGGTDTAQLVITIVGANDTPVIIDPTNPVNNPTNPLYDPENPVGPTDPLNIIPDVSRTDGQPLDPINVADFVPDPDGEPLSFAVDPTTPSWIVIDPVTGVITGTPPANASQLTNTGNPGEYLVTITATDPDGTVATTTVTLTITNVPPVAENDLGTTPENTPVTGNVLVDNGFGPDHDGGVDADPVRVGGVVTGTATPVDGIGLSTPVAGDNGGMFTVEPYGAYVFEPGTAFDDLAPGETRTTTVTYVIFDDNGDSDTATLTVTVTGENDAPTAIDPTTGLPPVDPVTGLPVDPTVVSVIPPITGNDSTPITPVSISDYFGDVDVSQGPPALTVDPTALPPGITFDPAMGTFGGTPTSDASQGGNVPGQPGVYRVPVTATDPEGATVTTFVTFTISNPPPVAVTDVGIVTDENVAITFPVLGNDSDPDGDTIRVVSASSPNGTVVVNLDGTLAFAPNPGFAGTATVTYVITDDQGGFATAVAEITVRPSYTPMPGNAAPPLAPQPEAAPEPIEADGAVTAAVNGLPDGLAIFGDSQTRMAASLGERQVVSAAVNGADGLGGLWSQDQSLALGGEPPFIAADGAVLQESSRIKHLWQPALALPQPFDFGHGALDPISGFSLRFGALPDSTGQPRFTIESIVRDDVLILTLADVTARDGATQVVDYRITRMDGRAIPGWLERPSVDVLQGRRSAETEVLDLRVTAILSDGTEQTQDVRINVPSGEIGPLIGRRSDIAPSLLQDQFQTTAQLSEDESADLGRLLIAAE